MSDYWKPKPIVDKKISLAKQEKLLEKAMVKIKLVRILQLVIKDKYEYKNAVEQLNTDHLLREAYVNDKAFQT